MAARNSGDLEGIHTKLLETHKTMELIFKLSAPELDISAQKMREFIQILVTRFICSKAITSFYHQPHADYLTTWKMSFDKATKESSFTVALSKGEGCYVWDMDGNKLIDTNMGYGAIILGYNHPVMVNAVKQVMETGFSLGAYSALAGETAQLMMELVGMERACFFNSGSEAVCAAMRCARMYTGKPYVIMGTGSYHGWIDSNLVPKDTLAVVAIGTTSQVGKIIVDYGSDEIFDLLRSRAHEIAAVCLEPVRGSHPNQEVGWLRRIREVTQELGILLIFDEVFTGFRVHGGGAQALFDIPADLACYGKVLGGGMPMGAVACRGDILDCMDGGVWRYGDDPSVPRANVAGLLGTFSKHPVSMATAKATLQYIKAHPEMYVKMAKQTQAVTNSIAEFYREHNISTVPEAFGSFMSFYSETGNPDTWLEGLRFKGVLMPNHTRFIFCAEHSDRDISYIAHALRESYFDLVDPRRKVSGKVPSWLAEGYDPTFGQEIITKYGVPLIDHQGKTLTASGMRTLNMRRQREIKQLSKPGPQDEFPMLDIEGTEISPRFADPSPCRMPESYRVPARGTDGPLCELNAEHDALLASRDLGVEASKVEQLAGLVRERFGKTHAIVGHFRQWHADNVNCYGNALVTPATKALHFPLVATGAEGPLVTDAEGRRYLDFGMGLATCFLGHKHPVVHDAVLAGLEQKRWVIGFQCDIAGENAKLIGELGHQERVCFTNSGSEAGIVALRLARAKTLRPLIILVDGCQHGWIDTLVVPKLNKAADNWIPGSPGLVEIHQFETVQYGSDELFEILRTRGDLVAAVMMEPVPSATCAPDAAWLRRVREATTEAGAALIFDEVWTGFRCHLGGAQAALDVHADLVIYGKSIAGGFPIGCLAGAAEFMKYIDGGMWNFGDESTPGPMSLFAGTFCKHPLSMIAMFNLLTHYKETAGALQQETSQRMDAAAQQIREYVQAQSLPVAIGSFGGALKLTPQWSESADLLRAALLLRGIQMHPRGVLLLSPAHTQEMLDYTVGAVQEALREVYTPGTQLTAPPLPAFLADVQAPQCSDEIMARNGIQM
eukprot:gnl/Trimastix_PCT/586.p1 GENE.gnl/Trimastix_PCT/586~~gnl/Trimastix_PCT/586.p1  ORF type:complete len:1066 (+),score=378.60 gnl/Trimastix_PCT/586:1454-4651(+)